MDKAQGVHSSDTDEIDLFQLCGNLWEKRVLIVLCTVFVTVCGVAYAYSVPYKFKAEVRLYPSYELGLPKVNAQALEVSVNSLKNGDFKVSFNSEEDKANNLVGQYLAMESTTAELLQRNNYTGNIVLASPKLLSSAQVRAFNKQVLLKFSEKEEKLDYWNVSLLWDSPDQAVQLLDALVDISIARARKELIQVSRAHHQREIQNIDHLIEEKKIVAVQQIENEIARLREAKVIADKINLSESLAQKNDNLAFEAQGYQNITELRELYSVGSKVLANEIRLLEQRKNDVVLLAPEVIALNERRLLLAEANFDSELVIPAKADPAVVYPVKRATLRIVAISFVLGLVLGSFFALLSISFAKWKVEEKL